MKAKPQSNLFWLALVLMLLGAAPAIVLACMPLVDGMAAGPAVDVTQELPGGG